MKESFVDEIVWNEEDGVIEQSLHEEVIQSFYEKQDPFVQVSEKSSFNNSVVNDNFVAMSYEDDQQCIKIAQDQGIEDCHSDFPYISCFELLFQEDICSPICSEIFEDYEYTLAEVHYEERSYSREKDTLFLLYQREVIFMFFRIQ